MTSRLPETTIERLGKIYDLCRTTRLTGEVRLSSSRIGKSLGIPGHTVRKDINFLGEIGNTGYGYDLEKLEKHLAEALGFLNPRKACIVGLGRLGSALLEYRRFKPDNVLIEAGFDSSINRLETIVTPTPLFPAYEIPEVVRRKNIELALLAVPAKAAPEAAALLAEGGIKGIINFTPVTINPDPERILIRNINLANELRVLSSLLFLRDDEAS